MPSNHGAKSLLPKQERLKIFFKRLEDAPRSSSFDEAYRLLCNILNKVEDEHTNEPNDPTRYKELDRMFPPQTDRMTIKEFDVKRFDSKKDMAYIAPNGAIEIRSLWLKNGNPVVHLTKPGTDGRTVVDILPQLKTQNL